MHFVLIVDAWKPLVGGGQKLLWELSSRLVCDHHCQVTVVTRSLKVNTKIASQSESFFNNQLNIIRLGKPVTFFNLWARINFIFSSFFYCLKLHPDKFIGSTWLPAITLFLLKIFKSIPTALIVIGFGSTHPLAKLFEKIISEYFTFDLLFTDDLQFYNRIKTTKNCQFIPNGVDLPVKPRLPKYSQFTFLTLARNEPRKGIPILLKSFSQVKKLYPKVDLHLFGPGFKLLPQDQFDQEFFKSHCLVLPSLREGHPLVLFEAWAHQLPVIATKVGSINFFLKKNNGYLIIPGSVESLVRAMVKAINNSRLNFMGKNGYDLVAKNYTWSKTVNSYYQALS